MGASPANDCQGGKSKASKPASNQSLEHCAETIAIDQSEMTHM